MLKTAILVVITTSMLASQSWSGPDRISSSRHDKPSTPGKVLLPARENAPDVATNNFADMVKAPQAEAPSDLKQLLEMSSALSSKPVDMEVIQRMTLVRSAGFEVGLSRGFESLLSREQARLARSEDLLNQLFSFRDLFLLANFDHPAEEALHLQPPIISELEDVVQIEDDGKILRTIDGVYRIIDKEKFVSQPPRWQEYLMSRPPELDIGVYEVNLPATPEEQEVWRDAVSKGWQQGRYQAVQEIEQRILTLGRDFNGMLAYVELKLSGKINAGYVARERRGVDGGGDEMSVNARTYQITNESGLNPSTENWEALVSKGVPPSYESAGLRVFRHVNKCAKGDAQECP